MKAKSYSWRIIPLLGILFSFYGQVAAQEKDEHAVDNITVVAQQIPANFTSGDVEAWAADVFGGGNRRYGTPYVIRWGGLFTYRAYMPMVPAYFDTSNGAVPPEDWIPATIGTKLSPYSQTFYLLTEKTYSSTFKKMIDVVYIYTSSGSLMSKKTVSGTGEFWDLWDNKDKTFSTRNEESYVINVYKITTEMYHHIENKMGTQDERTYHFAWTPQLIGTVKVNAEGRFVGPNVPDAEDILSIAPIAMTRTTGQPEYCKATGATVTGYSADISSLARLYPDLDLSGVTLTWSEGEDGSAKTHSTANHTQAVTYSTNLGVVKRNTYGVTYNTEQNTDGSGRKCLEIPSKSGYAPLRIYKKSNNKDKRAKEYVDVYDVPATPGKPVIKAGFVNGGKSRAGGQYGTKLSAPHQDGITYKWYYNAPTEANKIGEGDEITIYPTSTVTVVYVACNDHDCTTPSNPIIVEPIAIPTVKSEAISASAACNSGTSALSVKNMQPGGKYRVLRVSDNAEMGSATASAGNTTLNVDVPSGDYKVTAVFTDETGGTYELNVKDKYTVGAISLAGEVAPVEVCGPQSVTLTVKNNSTRSEGTASYQYEWYNAAKNVIVPKTTSTSTTQNVTASSTYYVRIFDAHCESDFIPAQVTIKPLPKNASVNVTGGFAGTKSRLAVSNPEADITYKWYADGQIAEGKEIATGNSIEHVFNSAEETVWVRGMSKAGCYGTPVQVQVKTVALPVAQQVEADANICDNGTPVFKLKNTVAGTTYRAYKKSGEDTWATSPSAEFEGTGSAAEVKLPDVGTYKIFAEKTDGMGAKKTADCGIITVNRYAKVTGVVTPVERCGAGSVTVTASDMKGGSGTYEYEWYNANKAVAKGKGPQASFTTTVTATSVYYLKIFSANCESDFIPVNVTVNPLPEAPAAPQVTAAFVGSESKAVINGGNGNYKWYKSGANGQIDMAAEIGQGRELNYALSSAEETVWVLGVSDKGCDGAPTSVVMKSVALPVAQQVEADANICDNGTPVFKLKNTVAGTTYRAYKKAGEDTWATSPSAEFEGTGSAAEVKLPDVGTYKIFAEKTDGMGAKKTVDCGIITVNRYEKVTGAVESVERCGEGSVTLTAAEIKGGSGSYEYEWYNSNKAVAKPKGKETAFTTTVKETADFYLKVFSDGCESDFIPVKVTVNPLPEAPSAPQVTAAFVGSESKAVIEGGNGNYKWYKSGTNGQIDMSAEIGQGKELNYALSAAEETVWVLGVSDKGCEGTPTSVLMKAIVLPVAQEVEAEANICDNGTPVFKLKNTVTGTTYRAYKKSGEDTWATSPSAEFEGTGSPAEVELPDVGVYKVVAEKTDELNKKETTDCGIISIDRYEKVEGVVEDADRCGEGSVTLTASEVKGGSGSYEYEWYDSNKAVAKRKGEEKTFTTTVKATADFYLKVFSDGCESDFIPVKVTVNPLPNAPAAPQVTTGFVGEQSRLVVPNPVADMTYKWFKSNSTGEIDAQSPIGEGKELNYKVESASETVWIIAVSKLGCESQPVKVEIKAVDLPKAQQVSAQKENIYINEKPVILIASSEKDVTYRIYKNAGVDKWESSPAAEVQGTGSALSVELKETGTYKVMAEKKDAMGVSKASECGIVTIAMMKEISAQCPDIENCGPGDVTFVVANTTGGAGQGTYQYEWYNANKAVVKAKNKETSYTFQAQTSGDYYLRVFSNDYASEYIKIKLTVNPLPDFKVQAVIKLWQEQGETFDLMSVVAGGQKNGHWTGALVGDNKFSVKGATPGQTYTLQYTEVTDKGCSSVASAELTVFASEAKWVKFPDICNGTERINLADYVTPKGGTFSANIEGVCEETGIFYPAKLGVGKATITYNYTSEAGVPMTTEKVIEVKERTKIEIPTIEVYTIPNRDEVLAISDPVEGVEYKWYDGEQEVAKGNSFTTKIGHGVGEKAFTIKAVQECASYSGMARIVMDTIPDFTPTAQYETVTTNQPVQVFTNLEDRPTYTYAWKSGTMAFSLATPFFVWHTTGTMPVEVTVSNTAGHQVTKQLEVEVTDKVVEKPNTNYVEITAPDASLDGTKDPTAGMAEILIHCLKKQDASVKITDNLGKVFFEKEMSLSAGDNKLSVQEKSLPKEYFVYVYLKTDKLNLVSKKN